MVRAVLRGPGDQPVADDRTPGRTTCITIWDAAAPASSQAFLLVGAVVLIPIILGYTGYAYWVFRGKVRPGMHYH